MVVDSNVTDAGFGSYPSLSEPIISSCDRSCVSSKAKKKLNRLREGEVQRSSCHSLLSPGRASWHLSCLPQVQKRLWHKSTICATHHRACDGPIFSKFQEQRQLSILIYESMLKQSLPTRRDTQMLKRMRMREEKKSRNAFKDKPAKTPPRHIQPCF